MDYVWELGHALWVGRSKASRNKVLHVQATGSTTLAIPDLPAVPDQHRRLVLISDTHEQHRKLTLPPCDLLLHCGDVLLINRHFSVEYSCGKIVEFGNWLQAQDAAEKLVIAGNHDHALEVLGKERVQELLGEGVQYLEHEFVDVLGLKIFASPWSPGGKHRENHAFQSSDFTMPPERVHILMTHGQVPLKMLQAIQPEVAVCGHIHEQYGVQGNRINCSIMDGRFSPTHCPVVLDMRLPAN